MEMRSNTAILIVSTLALIFAESFSQASVYNNKVSQYRVSHLLVDLGWVDFDLGVPPSCPTAQPLLPNSHQPRENWSGSETLKIQVNPNQSTSRWYTLCATCHLCSFFNLGYKRTFACRERFRDEGSTTRGHFGRQHGVATKERRRLISSSINVNQK